MGSSLNFRSRPLDIDRPLPVYEEYELPDLFDACLVNRTVTKVPTGMEKEEECELDLQRALDAQKNNQKSTKSLIPVPEVFLTEIDYFPKKVDIPQKYIGEELVSIIDDVSNYDMDEIDYKFVTEFTLHANQYHDATLFTFDEFESMMELMETTYKSSKSIEKVLDLIDKKQVNKYVFQHWEKRRKMIKPNYLLIPTVRTCDKLLHNDPFVAFRKRVEKMQTRKNRKLDELRYMNACRISHSLNFTSMLLDLMAEREALKLERCKKDLQLFYLRCNEFFSNYKVVKSSIKPSFQDKKYHHKDVLLNKNELENIQRQTRLLSWRYLLQVVSNRLTYKKLTKSGKNHVNRKVCSQSSNGFLLNHMIHKNYAIKMPKSFLTTFSQFYCSHYPKSSVYLRPLRNKPPFFCSSKDEYIRKLYTAYSITEYYNKKLRKIALTVPVVNSEFKSSSCGCSNDNNMTDCATVNSQDIASSPSNTTIDMDKKSVTPVSTSVDNKSDNSTIIKLNGHIVKKVFISESDHDSNLPTLYDDTNCCSMPSLTIRSDNKFNDMELLSIDEKCSSWPVSIPSNGDNSVVNFYDNSIHKSNGLSHNNNSFIQSEIKNSSNTLMNCTTSIGSNDDDSVT